MKYLTIVADPPWQQQMTKKRVREKRGATVREHKADAHTQKGSQGKMTQPFNVISVCSGIGTDALAWHPLGWQHLCFSEIEKFPSAVLAQRWPGIVNRGDFTKIGDEYRGSADVLVGGTPCQSFSIAGLRGGLADDRGNLALEFLRLADRTRPRWVVWENVPGVLSSLSHDAPDPCEPPPPMDMERDGQEVETEDDYRAEEIHALNCFLAGLSELGYGWSRRVLDAQYFGVPQRRRRVFVVGHLGDWRRAAAVLFERHSLQGNHPPRREARESVAGTVTSGIGKRRGSGFNPGSAIGVEIGPSGGRFTDTHPTLDTRCKDGFIRNQLGGGVLTGGFFDQPFCVETAPTIRAGGNRTGGDRPPGTDVDTADSLIVAFQTRIARNGRGTPEEIAPALNGANAGETSDSRPCVIYPVAWDEELNAREDQSGAVIRGGEGGRHAGVMTQQMAVRRLTPRECERLQGLPDDHTLVTFNGKPASDGPRYKAIGNGMAMPVLRWIGERIAAVEAEARP